MSDKTTKQQPAKIPNKTTKPTITERRDKSSSSGSKTTSGTGPRNKD